MLRAFVLAVVATVVSVAGSQSARGRERFEIVEPKKIRSPAKLKDGEGAVQLSVRTQTQATNTAIFYFIAVDENGRDTNRVIRFERGAGVPLMGSNMIDEKQQVYRVPAGRYRPIAFTVACDEMPTAPGLVCSQGFGNSYPTGFYPNGTPVFEVREGEFTRAGDFIVEYTGSLPPGDKSLLNGEATPLEWAIRWREGSGTADGFEALPMNRASVPDHWRSRITCDARPEGVMLYIPFNC